MNSLRMMQSTCPLFPSNASMTSPLLDAETPGQLVFEQAIDELPASVAHGSTSQNAAVSRGQKNTERMLKALLGALGFGHVEAVFAKPPKT